MTSNPKISDSEWQVMEVIWTKNPVPAADVVEALKKKTGWNPRTIKTLLNRLVKKNVLGFREEGNRYIYRPKVKREECVRQESRSFISRVFGGRTGEMLCRFVDEVDLSPQEIEELQRILQRKRR